MKHFDDVRSDLTAGADSTRGRRSGVLGQLLAAALALAMSTIPVGAQAAAPPTPDFQNVLSAATLDFNGDAEQDRAVLVQNTSPDQDGEADLYVYLSVPNPNQLNPTRTLALTKKAVVFSGSLWGQQPSLAVSDKGSLLIISTNTGIGRDKWEQTLSVVYRDKTFLIAGITYSVRDALDPKGGGSCDLNLLAGKGLRNGRQALGTFAPIPLADWSDDKLPKACQF